MNSIKKKLFIQIGSLIVILVTLILLANTLLLEAYYTSKQKNKLIDYYYEINSFDSNNYTDSLSKFVKYQESSNIDILIISKTGEILYSSNSYLEDPQRIEELNDYISIQDKNNNYKPPKPPKQPMEITKIEVVNDKIGFAWGEDLVFNNQNLFMSATLDNGNLIEMRLPIASIKTNINLLNSFLIIIGLLVFIIALIFTYVVSNNFTKPIREMNVVTKRMKKLDFTASCQVQSNDELGQLAQSINEMSNTLSKSIKSLNQKNTLLKDEIAQKNKLDKKRRELLNNVSHELKTPLALLQGYAEGLKLNVIKNKEKSNFYCDVIMDESKKMNQLVESLLDLDQMEFGDQILNKTAFEVNDFVVNTANKFTKVFEDNNITWKVNTIDSVEVFADIFMMERVLRNYISNAINYINNGLLINIDLIKLKDCIRIEVFNTASPIEENELEKIWDSFYKLDKARTREKGGHGLGLSIVKAIQEAHNSKYGVKNMDNGVCFWFDINYK